MNQNKTYLVNYGVYFINGDYESHTINVKNCMSELHAKIKLEGYLKKKYINFQRLVVYSCNDDFMGLFNSFK